MTSERQKAANRANALRSTGPKTSKGKEVVRLNALRHGLLAHDIVLPGEDEEAFEDLWNAVRANLSPVGPIEEFLADQGDEHYLEATAADQSGNRSIPFTNTRS